MEQEQPMIGRVLRSSTTGFTCGTRSHDIATYSFGAFVQTQQEVADHAIIGLIYAVHIDDDPLVKQLIMADRVNAATIRDQRENRMIPVEISVVNVGFLAEGVLYQNLPPRPPISLDVVRLCDRDMIYSFTQRLDFFRLVLNTAEVPAEELIAAALRQAAAAYPPAEQRTFLVAAGRKLAQLLSHDLSRLSHVLRMIRPMV
jgi:hypothetical protein